MKDYTGKFITVVNDVDDTEEDGADTYGPFDSIQEAIEYHIGRNHFTNPIEETLEPGVQIYKLVPVN